MARRKRPAKNNKLFLKVSSLMLGTLFWYVWSGVYPLTRHVSIPLSFYNVPEGKMVSAQDDLHVQLRATRPAFIALDDEQLVVHVDARKFADGPNGVAVTTDSLFLPDNVRLVDCTPSNTVAFMKTVDLPSDPGYMVDCA